MKIDNSSLRNSASITSAIFDNYYPNGKQIVKNTSFASEGVYGRTLTSRTIADAFNGDAIYRSPKFSLTFYNKIVNSSLNSLVTGGAESVHESPTLLRVESPENIDGDVNETMLVGGTALNRIIAESAISRKGSAEFITSSSAVAIADMTNIQKDPEYVAAIPHSATGDPNDTYSTIEEMVTLGKRTIALDAELTEEEKAWIIERGTLLRGKGVVSDGKYLTDGFPFNIPDGIQNLKQTETYFEGMSKGIDVEQSLVDAPVQKAYICPSMIELLIYLESKASFKGQLGAERATDPYGQTINNGAPQKGSSINDHVFGRAFDLIKIEARDGTVATNFKKNGNNVETYRQGLNLLLSILNSAPSHLKPDVITVSSDLGPELGIIPGLEMPEAAVKKQYPNLRYVNFKADIHHKNNIHFSFSAQRSGQYVGPGGELGIPGQFLVPSIGAGAFSPGAPADINNPKFRKNYAASPSESLTAKEVFDLLRGTVMSDEAAAIFYAVVVRESLARPAAFNPNTGTGDWSVGMFQVNLLTSAHGTKDFYFPVGDVTLAGWQLGYRDWQKDGVTQGNFDSTVRSKWASVSGYSSDSQKVSALFPLVDRRVWVPLNQVSLAYSAIVSRPYPNNLPPSERLGSTPENGYIFFAWGDYGGGPWCGFISDVDFKDAIDVYVTCGKNPIQLKEWTLEMFKTSGSKSKSAPYANGWVNGTVYKRSGGSVKEHSEAELYPPTAPSSGSGGSAGGGGGGGGGGSGAGAGANIPAYNPDKIPPAGNSSGAGGQGIAGLNGYLALAYARWCLGKFPYAAVNPYRFGIDPWPGGILKSDWQDKYYGPYDKGTLVFDCSGYVVNVYWKAGLDFRSRFGAASSSTFNDPRINNALPFGSVNDPANGKFLRPLDIFTYDGHMGMINSISADGSVQTIESTPKGVVLGSLNWGRVISIKRIFPPEYFL